MAGMVAAILVGMVILTAWRASWLENKKMEAGETKVRFWSRKAHRWMGLAIGIQLLLWTISGFYFALNPIETIRGEHLTIEETAMPSQLVHRAIAPSAALDAVTAQWGEPETITDVRLLRRGNELFYRVAIAGSENDKVALVNATTGALQPALTQKQAIALAAARLVPEASVRQATLVTETSGGHEYRGKPLPAWRIAFDSHGSPVLWLDATTGEITARRTTAWRIFDFLWMLHILDFENRDDFGNWLLKIMAALGIFTVLSGFILWCVTTPLLRRKNTK